MEILDLPKKRDTELLNFLKTLFQVYKQEIIELNIKELDLNLIDETCNSILETIDLYYKGYISESYYRLKVLLDKLEEYLILPNKKSFKISPSFDTNYYRIRLEDSKLLNKEDLFHIPLDKRENISPKRYSINGFPCLYLGSSIYSCWMEFNQPDLSKIQVSRFEIPHSFNYLDLTYDYQMFKRCFNNKENADRLGIYFLTSWPLVATCSLQVKEKELPFKPEYIIPQIVLEWIRQNKKLDGVKYFSSINPYNKEENYTKLNNLVIPIKDSSSNKFCNELKSKIKFTEPLSYKALTVCEPNYMTKYNIDQIQGDLLYKISHSNLSIELQKGKPIEYFESVFGKMEIILAGMNADIL